jgi:hypothetical protein
MLSLLETHKSGWNPRAQQIWPCSGNFPESCLTFVGVGRDTEYTQSGNGHFMAYIPSWWKNQPSLVRWGMHAPLFHYIYHHVQSCSVRSSREGIYIHSPYFLSTPILYVICGERNHVNNLAFNFKCGGGGGGGGGEFNFSLRGMVISWKGGFTI